MSPLRIIAICLLLVATVGCNKWSENRIRETKRRGEIIAPAIEAYHTKYGRFPAHLEDLKPEFLRDIPQPTAGYGEWDYLVVSDGREWALDVAGSEWGPQLSRISDGEWLFFRGDHK